MVAGLDLAHHGGRHGRHAARGGARRFRAFEQRHALLEHGHGRVGEARIDEARVLALEARLGGFHRVVDEALGQEHRFGRFAELRAQRAAVDQARGGRSAACLIVVRSSAIVRHSVAATCDGASNKARGPAEAGSTTTREEFGENSALSALFTVAASQHKSPQPIPTPPRARASTNCWTASLPGQPGGCLFRERRKNTRKKGAVYSLLLMVAGTLSVRSECMSQGWTCSTLLLALPDRCRGHRGDRCACFRPLRRRRRKAPPGNRSGTPARSGSSNERVVDQAARRKQVADSLKEIENKASAKKQTLQAKNQSGGLRLDAKPIPSGKPWARGGARRSDLPARTAP